MEMNHHRNRGDRGAILIIVAVFALVACLMAAFVVDLGAQRAERIATATAADAASLAAAAVVDTTNPRASGADRPCAQVRSTDPAHPTAQHAADHYWRANGGTGSPTCTVTSTAGRAYVTVAGSRSVDYAFAGIIGTHEGSVTAGSSATAPSPPTDPTVYPLAICGTPRATTIAAGGVAEHAVMRYSSCGLTKRHRQVNYGGNGGDACTRAGRWCFDFSHGGWPGSVPPRVALANERWTPVIGALDALVASGDHFWILAGTPVAPGYTQFDVTHFVEVRMLSYASKQYMEFVVYAVAPYSAAGPPALSTEQSEPVRLCATSADRAGCTTTNGDSR